MAGILISFISVGFMVIFCLNYLTDFRGRLQAAYSNVYDIMFNFFRNGNAQMLDLFKIELDSRIMDPFTTKLYDIRLMLEDIIFALQVAFFISILVAFGLFLFSLINLILDFKT